jgi:hypothetical protein
VLFLNEEQSNAHLNCTQVAHYALGKVRAIADAE